MHDPEYRRSLKDWESFVETLTERIIEADETVPELPIKDVVFRIYRDIRFSKDPTPYKVSSAPSSGFSSHRFKLGCWEGEREPLTRHVRLPGG